MSIHRGIAVAAALTLALGLAGCTDDSPDPGPTKSTKTEPSASSTPFHATGQTDPAGESIPIDGDDDAPITWKLDDPGATDDPAVTVARRVVALSTLGQFSNDWSSVSKLQKALDAVAAPDTFSSQTVTKRWTGTKKTLKAPVKITVAPATGQQDDAVVLMCLDARDAVPSGLAAYTYVTKVELSVTGGVWKATSVVQNSSGESEPADKAFAERCDDEDGHP